MKKTGFIHTHTHTYIYICGGMLKNTKRGTSLVVQLFRSQASTAGDIGSIPSWETKILHACSMAKRKKHKERVFAIFLYCCIKQEEDIFKEYNWQRIIYRIYREVLGIIKEK